jgi:hypothetical protein
VLDMHAERLTCIVSYYLAFSFSSALVSGFTLQMGKKVSSAPIADA